MAAERLEDRPSAIFEWTTFPVDSGWFFDNCIERAPTILHRIEEIEELAKVFLVKLVRAHGECLGISRR